MFRRKVQGKYHNFHPRKTRNVSVQLVVRKASDPPRKSGGK